MVIRKRHFGKEGPRILKHLLAIGALIGNGENDTFQLIQKLAHGGGLEFSGSRRVQIQETRVFHFVEVHHGDGVQIPGAMGGQQGSPERFEGFVLTESNDPGL